MLSVINIDAGRWRVIATYHLNNNTVDLLCAR